MAKYQFDNNVQVVMSPNRDAVDEGWEESVVCYPTAVGWELVVGFEVDENKPVEEWAIDYLGAYGLKDGKHEAWDFAAGYGHKLGTQTVGAMLPDGGLYVKRIWECMLANHEVDTMADICWGISEQISQIEYQLEDLTVSSGRRQAKAGELAALRDDLEKHKTELEKLQAEHERVFGEDPTFEVIDS